MAENKFILTICIPTIVSRKPQFDLLRLHLQNQTNEFGLRNKVEIISECDNKEISIGAKRHKLIWRAKGLYIVMIDDDDWVPYFFIQEILEAVKSNPDCVGYLEDCHFGNNVRKKSIFSIRFSKWADNVQGFDYVRSPFFKSPIRTELARQIGCKDLRFGEDHLFAKEIYHLLKKEVFINKQMYIYRHKEAPHNEKYGIR